MNTRAITIRVHPDVARAYEEASPEDRRKLDIVLSLKLSEATRSKRPLEEIMREISRRAQSRGLTPEILDSILHGE